MGKFVNEAEFRFYDGINREYANLVGTKATLYRRQISKEKRNPLHNEPASHEWVEYKNLTIYMVWPENSPILGDEGLEVSWEGEATISRQILDDADVAIGKPKAFSYPEEADVIEVWRGEQGAAQSAEIAAYLDRKSRGGLFFDVAKVETDGHIDDSVYFTQFKLTLTRNNSFGADRQVR